jgi:hypothetical protein
VACPQCPTRLPRTSSRRQLLANACIAASRVGLIHRPPTRTAANRAAAEKRTVPFSRSRPIILRNQRLAGFGVVYRGAAHSPQKTGVQIQPPFTGFHTDLAPLFKLPQVSQRLWLTVYDYVRAGTEDVVLCCGRVDCEAQDSRGCQTSACNGHHDCLHPQSQGCIFCIVHDALPSLARSGDFAVTPITLFCTASCDDHHEDVDLGCGSNPPRLRASLPVPLGSSS